MAMVRNRQELRAAQNGSATLPRLLRPAAAWPESPGRWSRRSRRLRRLRPPGGGRPIAARGVQLCPLAFLGLAPADFRDALRVRYLELGRGCLVVEVGE